VNNVSVLREGVRADASDTAGGLLERASELSVLGDCLTAVQHSSSGRVVLVSGEAGAGKTALLRRFCEECGESARVLWGGCDPLFTPRPLGPLFAVADSVGGELEAVMAGQVLPHELVAAVLRELRARGPTIFVLEDMHWADEATLDVLRLLAGRVQGVPAVLIASYRDDQLDRTDPLRIMLGELPRSQTFARLKLLALSPEAVAQLASPYGVDGDELYRKTSGNPFFVIEALAAPGEEIPQTVRDAVLARAARLSPEARRLLEAVAVVPPRAELWLLEALAGEAVEGLDECLASGMLMSEQAGVGFRHELARLALEDSIPLNRSVELHCRALVSLSDPPGRAPDLARLAHHAEASRDVDAVLRFAPAAADRAAVLGAHREAAAQYARALRFGDRLAASERVELLKRRAEECYATDQYDDGISALERALECCRALGDILNEGDSLRRLSEFLWCPGRTSEAERCAREAVTILERLPPGRELGLAYTNLAYNSLFAARVGDAVAWGQRALELGERLHDTEIAVEASTLIGACQEDFDVLGRSLDRARRAGLTGHVGNAYFFVVDAAVRGRHHTIARTYLEPGIAYCSERGLELLRLYLFADGALLELREGHWSEATELAAAVLRIPRTSTTPRILALVVLGLLRARRGDPDQQAALDEAWELAEPTGELPRLGPVAAARAEAAWLAGDRAAVDQVTAGPLALALERKSPWLIGELAVWRYLAGLDFELPRETAKPYALQVAGDWARGAALWREIGCPYEAALALAGADGDGALHQALDQLQALGAQAAAVIVARRLRERGARNIPRGPRPRTRENPAGLTAREFDVLALLVDGLRNAQIAQRLVVSEKTVDHHVSAILRKLNVGTRAAAAAEAARRGLTNPS
jgi:DNA-binding CsgD family transcriptional regulator/tetratricopeptide (TPR) repeat protein